MAEFTHFDEQGASRMVNVGGKEPTHRIARATASVKMTVSYTHLTLPTILRV